ncbi:MAG: acyl CoA:acetate/3-ketoacid CoA transferase, beta subunit [Actinomycetia bacterium]|nr:acyl CoA:acetate/3-ketoacid CoA transferase, beta subunit [Actinomycetes bacterium]
MTDAATVEATRADVCAAALADCFRADGEILANPIGNLPLIGGRLAKATFGPQLIMTDGEAQLVENVMPVGIEGAERVVSNWNPYRRMFDLLWSGRRHVIMGASQIDRFGNQNFAFIGDPAKPKAQLLGMRGAPGNTINHRTSYWIPNHSPRVFVERVDVVSGVGNDRAATLGPAGRFHELVHVVTNLAVLDFETPDRSMRLRSVHPGVTVDDVIAATGFDLVVPGAVPESRVPNAEELGLLRTIDPTDLRNAEVPV